MSYYVIHIYMVGSYFPNRDDAWEESIRIYEGGSMSEALEKAHRDALADEVSYETVDGYKLRWKVHSVNFIKEIISFGNEGKEVFSRSLTAREASSLLKKID